MFYLIYFACLVILSAVLYRMGGEFNTKWRDVGVSLCVVIALGLLIKWHWTLILVFGLMWGALSTYWKKKGTDARWINWLMTGAGYGIAVLPFIFYTGAWQGFAIRSIVLAVSTMLWSEVFGNVEIEESGRGALIILTIPLLYIGA